MTALWLLGIPVLYVLGYLAGLSRGYRACSKELAAIQAARKTVDESVRNIETIHTTSKRLHAQAEEFLVRAKGIEQ